MSSQLINDNYIVLTRAKQLVLEGVEKKGVGKYLIRNPETAPAGH